MKMVKLVKMAQGLTEFVNESVEKIEEFLRKQRLGWFRHVERMDDKSSSKALYSMARKEADKMKFISNTAGING